MIERVAVLVFTSNTKDKNHTIKIKDIKEDVTREELLAVMDYIVTNKVFITEVGALIGKASCTIETVNTTTMKF